ncbi:MAG: hypothetical protein OEY30_03080 [Candidatus Bathyarchaeota archaeon]|nr:hypothetical protein [Candidatus Bathyarchaeota archaeon]
MRRLKIIPFFKHNRAVSYTVSAIIITATTVALALVAFSYAYQVLEQQRGISEFEVAKKSILAFNDALENVAWKPGATRSTRFTAQYGYMRLYPNANNIIINATVNGVWQPLSTGTTFPGLTGIIEYRLSTEYVSFLPNYESYILGSNSSIISGTDEGYGRAAIRQQTGWVNITLDYRVRAMRTSVIKVNGVDTNYVDIWVIKLVIKTDPTKPLSAQPQWSYIHDFDLQAKSLNVVTVSKSFTNVNNPTTSVSVQIGSAKPQQVPITLQVPGQVVFSVVVAEVQVNV